MTSSLKRRVEKIEQVTRGADKVSIHIVKDPSEPRPERPPGCEFFLVINKFYDDSEDGIAA